MKIVVIIITYSNNGNHHGRDSDIGIDNHNNNHIIIRNKIIF